MDSLLVNDVPRIHVADNCKVKQAPVVVDSVDRGDCTLQEQTDADHEDVVQRPSVPQRKRKRRARTKPTTEVVPTQTLQQMPAEPASTPAPPDPDSDGDVVPPLVNSSDSEGVSKKRAKDDSSESEFSDDDRPVLKMKSQTKPKVVREDNTSQNLPIQTSKKTKAKKPTRMSKQGGKF